MHVLLFPFKIGIKGYRDASKGREIFLEGYKKKKENLKKLTGTISGGQS